MPHPLYTRHNYPAPRREPKPEQLALWQELLDIESWLRRKAEEMNKDSKLALRLDRGADQVERAANRIKKKRDNEGDLE